MQHRAPRGPVFQGQLTTDVWCVRVTESFNMYCLKVLHVRPYLLSPPPPLPLPPPIACGEVPLLLLLPPSTCPPPPAACPQVLLPPAACSPVLLPPPPASPSAFWFSSLFLSLRACNRSFFLAFCATYQSPVAAMPSLLVQPGALSRYNLLARASPAADNTFDILVYQVLAEGSSWSDVTHTCRVCSLAHTTHGP